MTEKTDDQSVLGSLPATRATRIGGERGAKARAKPKAGKAAAKPKTAAKPRAVSSPKASPKATAKPKPAPTTATKPRPVRAGAPSLADSTKHPRPTEPPQRGSSPPSGTELVTTAIQAAGELAQIGLAVGGQVLKRAVGKLPKP
jgi:hypothetical protein